MPIALPIKNPSPTGSMPPPMLSERNIPVMPGVTYATTPKIDALSLAEQEHTATPTDAALTFDGDIPGYEAPKANPAITALAVYLRDQFSKAKNARQSSGVDDQMMRAKRARERQYEPEKFQAIQKIMGNGANPNDYYVPVIETKCRDLVSWLMAVPVDENLWELEPAIMPDLPEELQSHLEQSIRASVAEEALKQHIAAGGLMTPEQTVDNPEFDAAITKQVNELLPKAKDGMMLQLKRKAKELTDRLSIKIEGQLDDGGWRKELETIYADIATYPAGFLKGPIPKKVKIPVSEYDDKTGMQMLRIEEKVVDGWKRVSPFNIFPSPDATGIDDADIFEIESITPNELYACIGLPGYDEKAIRRVLDRYRQGGLHEWVQFDSDRSNLDKRGIEYTQSSGSKIDMVCCWASVQGKMLRSYGMDEAMIPDTEREYSAWCYLIDSEVVMAQLNPNPLDKKPYYKASFVEDADKFWNVSIPDLIWFHQTLANMIARSIADNVAYSSRPITEINKDRSATGSAPEIYPGAKVVSTDNQMRTNGPLLRFYQSQLVTGELQHIYNFIMQQADQDSGVPHYIAGGQPRQPGAAKNTLGGMQLMRTDAARGLEIVRGYISKNIIQKSVEAQYYQTLKYDGIKAIGGVKVKTRGTEWLSVRDQQAQRIDETLTKSGNPIDMQIFGMKGRQDLWREKLRSMHIDADRLLPEDRELLGSFTGGQLNDNSAAEAADENAVQPGQPGVQPQPHE